MWGVQLFNILSINNLLLLILLVIIFVIFLAREEKGREDFSILAFLFMLLTWQACLLVQNILFVPEAAYPMFYFDNSGYAVLGYLGLVMFSYYFCEPVFEWERKAVFVVILAAIFSIMMYALFVEFRKPVTFGFNEAIESYTIQQTPLRQYIVLVEAVCTLLVIKNLIYKSVIFRGEMRMTAIKLCFALVAGILAYPALNFIIRVNQIHTNTTSTVHTFITGLLIIFFFWSYIDYSKMRINYSDKIRLIILFVLIIIISIISSFTFQVYQKLYVDGMKRTVNQIVFDVESGHFDRDYYRKRYGGTLEYITVKNATDHTETFLLGNRNQFLMFPVEIPADGVRQDFRLTGKKVHLYFTGLRGGFIIQAGFPYMEYRRHIHEFVSVGYYSTMAIIGILFVLLRVMVSTSLVNPMRGLLSGIEEIQKGNLDHRIDVKAPDEIGFISEEFNYMVSDLKERRDEIKRSEKKYRELTALLPDIIYETDMNFKITYLNEAGFALTGYGIEDISRGLAMNDIMEEEDFMTMGRMLERKAEGPGISIFTHRVKRKDGSFLYAENNAVVIVSEGRVTGIRGIIRDVTEKLRLEQRLIQSQKMEIIGSLAGGIAHDFNNILGGIIGSISLLEHKLKNRQDTVPDGIADDIETMKVSAERAMKMVERILGISRRQRLSMVVTDMARIVEHVSEICKNTFDKKIELDFRYDTGGALSVMGDATQLEQVLLNLCINAHDAMTIMRPAGEESSGALSVSLHRVMADPEFFARYPDALEREYICLRVSDTGVGMDPYTRERVFDPFFTTKEKERGTGLGLAMVYSIVKEHSGFIDLYSEQGVGTTFNIYIPSSQPDNAVDAAAVALKEHRTGEGTILVVEDDPTIQKTCRKILGVLGYDVIIAENGQRGVEFFLERHGEIDAVILDMVMPKRSGKETFVELIKIDPNVKVLISSGFRNDSRVDEVLHMGAKGFLQKPYTIEQLSAELEKVLGSGE
ncbi:MAG: response regulator [Spirochaetes bacterium]|nr:response regulator [Spirochaetota bacterium]